MVDGLQLFVDVVILAVLAWMGLKSQATPVAPPEPEQPPAALRRKTKIDLPDPQFAYVSVEGKKVWPTDAPYRSYREARIAQLIYRGNGVKNAELVAHDTKEQA